MATYVNDLRLKEIATGDEAGTWGTSTNTNLELIGEALGYGTQDCFSSDADATTTVADGAADPARAMYFKVTSSATLTAGRTLTIAPNTISRVMFIENATTGSQVITISQGTGGNVAIANGKTAVVYLDGAGSGAAVVDAMALVDPGITDTLAEVLVAGNATGGTDIAVGTGDDITFADSSKAIFGAGSDLQIYHDGSNSYIDENGVGNLFIRSVNGASARIYSGGTASSNLRLLANSGGEITLYHSGSAKLATSSSGIDVTGVITTDGMTTSADINFGDNDKAVFGAGSDLQIYHDGTNSYIVNTTNDLIIGEDTRVRIKTPSLLVNNAADTENLLTATENGAVTLFYDNTARLATTSTGIDVTGSVVSDGLTVDASTAVVQASNAGGTTSFEISNTNGVSTANNKAALYLSATGAEANAARIESDFTGTVATNHAQDLKFYYVGVSSSPTLGMTLNSSGLDVTGNLTVDAGSNGKIDFGNVTTNYGRLYADSTGTFVGSVTADPLIFRTTNTERMRIDGSGNVGIGTSSTLFDVLTVDDTNPKISMRDSGTERAFFEIDSSDNFVINNKSASAMILETSDTERMRIHSNGRVSIGSSPSSAAELLNLTATSGNGAGIEAAGNGNTLGSTSAFYGQGSGSDAYVWNRANSTILFGTNNTECARFGSSGDMEIGSNRVNQGAGRYLDIYNRGTDSVSFSILRLITEQVGSTSLSTSEFYKRKNGETTLWNHETSSDAYLRAGIGTTEAWRIHSSGNVLLGKSSPAFGTTGVELNNNGVAGKVFMTRSGGDPLSLNRLSSDGEILGFYKDSTTVGRLDAYIGYLKVYGGTGSAGSGLWFGSGAMYPVGATNVVTDNVMDIGHSSYRFQDIYASNGTIQTSDRNEKQDIEELSEAEQRVAVACKGLLRKFRWKSAVEEKGEDARIHFGIIAQDLQDAFTAEGLDAGRYGMFINSTWTDEETGEERSRMGVRYSELLAFIISAI